MTENCIFYQTFEQSLVKFQLSPSKVIDGFEIVLQ